MDGITPAATPADALATQTEVQPDVTINTEPTATQTNEQPQPPEPLVTQPTPPAPEPKEPLAQPNPDERIGALEKRLQAYQTRIVKSTAASVAARIGVNPDRIDTLIKLTDLNGIDADADDAGSAIEAAVRAALALAPEFAAAQGTGSVTGHRRSTAGESGATIAQIAERAMGIK